MREEKGTINVLVDAGFDDGNPMKSEKNLDFFQFSFALSLIKIRIFVGEA